MFIANFEDGEILQNGHGKRFLHTYTPKSHENLWRRHLQLDDENQKALEKEINSLRIENERLKKGLDEIRKDIHRQNDEITYLKQKLKNQDREFFKKSSQTNLVYEIKGKQLTFDEVIKHFNVLIERHHDLLNRKTLMILDLKKTFEKKNLTTSVTKDKSLPLRCGTECPLQKDVVTNLTKIRKEYGRISCTLTERNDKLEKHLRELERKVVESSEEIQNLRSLLKDESSQSSSSPMQLVYNKQKEIKYLKSESKVFQKENQPQKSEDEIRRISQSTVKLNKLLKQEIRASDVSSKLHKHNLVKTIPTLSLTKTPETDKFQCSSIQNISSSKMNQFDNLHDFQIPSNCPPKNSISSKDKLAKECSIDVCYLDDKCEACNEIKFQFVTPQVEPTHENELVKLSVVIPQIQTTPDHHVRSKPKTKHNVKSTTALTRSEIVGLLQFAKPARTRRLVGNFYAKDRSKAIAEIRQQKREHLRERSKEEENKSREPSCEKEQRTHAPANGHHTEKPHGSSKSKERPSRSKSRGGCWLDRKASESSSHPYAISHEEQNADTTGSSRKRIKSPNNTRLIKTVHKLR